MSVSEKQKLTGFVVSMFRLFKYDTLDNIIGLVRKHVRICRRDEIDG